jgi:hypothetical protein
MILPEHEQVHRKNTPTRWLDYTEESRGGKPKSLPNRSGGIVDATCRGFQYQPPPNC